MAEYSSILLEKAVDEALKHLNVPESAPEVDIYGELFTYNKKGYKLVGIRQFTHINNAFKVFKKDAQTVKNGDIILTVKGPAAPLLAGERTALNFIQKLSGIATTTNQFVKIIKGSKAGIFDTRKTLPGFRNVSKYAVRCGGGKNHRMTLSDMVLIKDNHLALIDDLTLKVKEIRKRYKKLKEKIHNWRMGTSETKEEPKEKFDDFKMVSEL